ncbi:MAG TPA: glucoamylase family protein [Acidobacteriota bacterium]|nr:glucoamylase family protein [Acidobacteriota bacterium]
MKRLQTPLLLFLLSCVPASNPTPLPAPLPSVIDPKDEELLEDLSRRSFQYFWEQSSSFTGLTLDRARSDGSTHDEHHRNAASIAATGFGLTAMCIAAERGWAPGEKIRERVRRTLRFLANRVFHKNGWFYHWLHLETGERQWTSEVSSIDTALLLAGVLTCRQYFASDSEIVQLATRIYDRVDFNWMRNGHPTLLSHGWTPEDGFLPIRWDTYSEHTILYLLAIGSRTHPIPPDSWHAWKRDPNRYAGYEFIGRAPLFTHQYSHAWVEYRGRRETCGTGIDYFENSVTATWAHRRFCLDLREQFPSYSEDLWGITASDSRNGYVAWGGPPPQGPLDGTVVPCAAAGSLMLAPEICLPVLRNLRWNFGDRIYGRYGFVDAFNPILDWVGPDVVGIDVGITLLSIENFRTGRVWRWFMQNPEIPVAMEKVGLKRVRLEKRSHLQKAAVDRG